MECSQSADLCHENCFLLKRRHWVATTAELLSPNPLPSSASVTVPVPFERPLSGGWRFRIKRTPFLFLLPDLFLFLLNRLSHRSLPSFSSQCVISGLDQQSSFLGYRAAQTYQRSGEFQEINFALQSFMCQAPLPTFLFSFSSCFAVRSASCSICSLLSLFTLLSARLTAWSSFATSCSRSSL